MRSPLLFAVPLIFWSLKCVIQWKTKLKSRASRTGLNIYSGCLSPFLHQQLLRLLLFAMMWDTVRRSCARWPITGRTEQSEKYQNQHEIANNYWHFSPFFTWAGRNEERINQAILLRGGRRKVTVLLNDYVLILVLSLCVYTTVNDMPIKTFIRPNSLKRLLLCF